MNGPNGISVEVTLAWFRNEDWPKLPQVMPDVWDTYEEWLEHAEKGYAKACSEFGEPHVHKMLIVLDKFIEWTKSNNKRMDSRGRSEYAAQLYANSLGN